MLLETGVSVCVLAPFCLMHEDFSDEFNNADLKDLRRSRRLVKLAVALAKSPGASISAASGGWAESIAAFRLLNSSGFDPRALLAPHARATADRCKDVDCVVVVQDTTEFDFTHMKAATGLGPLNDTDRRGFFLHSDYVVSEQGLPLGLLDAAILLREDETFGSTDTRKERPISDKESLRWVTGYLTASKLARELPDTEVFSVSDWEGDIDEVYQAWNQARGGPRAEWIIRANQDRALLNVVDGAPAKLFAALEAAPALGEIEFEVRAKHGRKKVKGTAVATTRSARTVCQTVRVMKITPRPPFRKGGKLEPVSFWAILAEETNPPANEEPIRWLLLTSKEICSLEEARRTIQLYLRRRDIEVFHRVLKTGCRVERIQLKTGPALINALMIYLVIAWRILYLTHLGRNCPDLPCGVALDEAEWKSATRIKAGICARSGGG